MAFRLPDDGPQLWPNRTVPFVIDPLLANAELLIKQAFRLIHEKTCIRFREKAPGDSDRFGVRFTRNDEICVTSQIGLRPGRARFDRGQGQEIQLGLDCLTNGYIQRALGLVLGLAYEETRVDREKYVRYNPLRTECIAALDKYEDEFRDAGDGADVDSNATLASRSKAVAISHEHSAAALGIVFDYASHMFVTRECFTPHKHPSARLGSNDDGATAGGSGALSVLDLEKLNAMYDCPACHSYRFMDIHRLLASPHSFESGHFNPVESGHDIDQRPLYVCRVYHGPAGALLVGKMKTTESHTNCWVADGGREYIYGRNFEVLTSPGGHNFTWGAINAILPSAILGGRTGDREPVYIGKCKVAGADSITSGSFQARVGALYVPFGGNAVKCSNFQLLTC